MKHLGKWQVGLEIKPNHLCIVACQYHRRSWRLCFVESLAFEAVWSWENDSISHNEWLPLLKTLRNQLPKNHSLRICLPPDLVLSHELKLAKTLNNRTVLYNYVLAAITQLFPDTAEKLVADYCVINSAVPSMQLTLARKATVSQLTQLFTEANLCLDVIELMPCALLPLCRMVGLGQHSLLLYQTALFWCWVYHDKQGLQAGWAHRAHYENPALCCQRLIGADQHQQWFFSDSPQTIPPGFMLFNPLASLFKNSVAFIPAETQANYLLACGLALREEDHLCNR